MEKDKSNLEKNSEPAKPAKPRFRLLFANTMDLGKSAMSVPKLRNLYGPSVTSKFHSAGDASKLAESEDVWQIIDEISKLRSLGPREKYKEPVLESHMYGWFQEKFIESHPETERVYFPRRDSEMVKVQNLIDNAAKADQLYQSISQGK